MGTIQYRRLGGVEKRGALWVPRLGAVRRGSLGACRHQRSRSSVCISAMPRSGTGCAAWEGCIEKAWVDRFLALLGPGASILDVGCGAAEPMAGYLVRAGCRVTGVDTSGPLLALARERLPEQEWIEADMRGLAAGRRFDGLVAWNSLFHLSPEDQVEMFPVFREHLRPRRGAAVHERLRAWLRAGGP